MLKHLIHEAVSAIYIDDSGTGRFFFVVKHMLGEYVLARKLNGEEGAYEGVFVQYFCGVNLKLV